MKQRRFYPTSYEILAFEQAARRAQAAELQRLLALALRRLKVLAVRGTTALFETLAEPPVSPARRGSDKPVARAPRSESVIEDLARSLPADLRQRYAADLAAAARIEPLITGGLAAWDFTVHAIAQAFQGAARGLHAVARSFEILARRLTPLH